VHSPILANVIPTRFSRSSDIYLFCAIFLELMSVLFWNCEHCILRFLTPIYHLAIPVPNEWDSVERELCGGASRDRKIQIWPRLKCVHLL